MNEIAEEQVIQKKRGRPRKTPVPDPPTQDEAVKDIAKKRKRPDLAEKYQTDLAPGDNTKYISNSLAMWDWEQPDMNDPVAVRQRVKEYFQLCAERDMKPTVPGFSFAFGVSRKTMWSWINGIRRELSPAVISELKRAYYILNIQMEDYMQNGKINPVSGIFLMKNNMGYEDKTEMVVTPNSPVGEELPEDELRRRIAGDVVIDKDAIDAEFHE